MNAEVKPGYKLAEEGVIPEGWSVVQLGDHVKITSGASPSLFRLSTDGIPYFKVEQLGNNPKHLDSESTPYHFKVGPTVQAGSIVFAKRGAAIALNKIRILSEESFMDTNIMALTPGSDLDSSYLFYALSHIGLWRFADTTSIPQINNKHIKPLLLSLPGKSEQRAITSALSDMDALISSLDQLIAKKRDTQQAAMQQLLTGQRRLPEFSGEWKDGKFRDVVKSLEAGISVNSTDDLPEPGLPCVLKTSALSSGHFLPNEAKAIIAADRKRACTNPKRNTILISRMNTPALVGEIAYVDKDYNWLFLPDRLWMTQFISDDCVNARWLAYLLSSRPYRRLLQDSATGTSGSMKNISKGVLLNLQISYPSIEEQTAIATILSDMDTELAALEARRDKARQIKQGMMQELLTGRIRLV